MHTAAFLAPPTAPAVAGLRFRPFAGAADFPAMAKVANACFAADAIEIVRTPEDMASDYASFTSCDPAVDVVMAEVDGELVGYARSWYWQQADGLLLFSQLAFVVPQWRRRGIGDALQGWLERHQRRAAARHPAATTYAHHAFLRQGEIDRAHLLRKASFQPVRHFFEMVRPDLEAIPDLAPPAGLEVRPVRAQHHRAIWDAHIEALRGVWAFNPPAPGDFELWRKGMTFQPELWQVAWDVARNEVAGQVKPYIDPAHNASFQRQRGWTEFISVGERWRRRGLARALVTRALHAQRAAGMTESALGVDSENAHDATRLYEDCGFRVVQRNSAWRKPFQPES